MKTQGFIQNFKWYRFWLQATYIRYCLMLSHCTSIDFHCHITGDRGEHHALQFYHGYATHTPNPPISFNINLHFAHATWQSLFILRAVDIQQVVRGVLHGRRRILTWKICLQLFLNRVSGFNSFMRTLSIF